MAEEPVAEISIEVQNLVKRYPKATFNAVDDISFSVQKGEIFGLLGPNGAGKTTTIGVLTTNIVPTSGSAHIMSIDVVADPMSVKQRIAVVPQQSNLDRSLRAREILTFHASYHGVPRAERNARADTLLEEFGLGDRGKDKEMRYSGGMAQRLMLARPLMHYPDVLVLDTPSELKKLIPGGTSLALRLRIPELVSIGNAHQDTHAKTQLLDALRALPGVVKVEEAPAQEGEDEQQGTTLFRLYAKNAGALVLQATQ